MAITALLLSAPIAGSAASSTIGVEIQADTVAELESRFAEMNYHWPPASPGQVPLLSLQRLPGDFPGIASANQRRELFLRAVLPLVMLENRRLRERRQLAEWMLSRPLPEQGSPAHRWLDEIRREFRVRGELSDPEVRRQILLRLDEIPVALALAQAAIESGWGTSRFALQGNSLFGQWTFQSGAGLTPNGRDPDATHLVASFPDLRASVRSYMRNLNSGRAYREFRAQRAALRRQGRPLSPIPLTKYLHRYSQRGEDYVRELDTIINGPGLNELRAEAWLQRWNTGPGWSAARADAQPTPATPHNEAL